MRYPGYALAILRGAGSRSQPGAPTGIARLERRVMSQNGEDGILRELFARIGEGGKYFVEFGVEDGLECNAAYLAKYGGWSGVMLEGDPDRAEALKRNLGSDKVTTGQAFLTRENIVEIFRRYAVPTDFDLLSIDVDGNDYWIWEALSEYKPRVVVIEYNATYPPPARWVMSYNPEHRWDGTSYFGASLASLVDLGSKLGYEFVGTESAGLNAFFVRRDQVSKLGDVRPATAQDAYHWPRRSLLRRSAFPYRSGPYEEI
jgi:hypothetical protein